MYLKGLNTKVTSNSVILDKRFDYGNHCHIATYGTVGGERDAWEKFREIRKSVIIAKLFRQDI